MTRRVIEHRDFSGGDWGIKQPWNAPRNSFQATNMLVYRTGELGVRAGLRNVTPTLPFTNFIANTMYTFQKTQVGFFTSNGTHAFQPYANGVLTSGSGPDVFTTPLVASTDNITVYSTGPTIYIDKSGDGIYKLSSSLGLTRLVSGVSGNGIALYGDRLVIGTSTGIRYNGLTAGVSDFTSWPVTNVIPVGDAAEAVSNVLPQRTFLTIPKETNGTYSITGSLGINETLRRAVEGDGPGAGTAQYFRVSTVTKDSLVWMNPALFSQCPLSFDGTVLKYWREQDLRAPIPQNVTITPFYTMDPVGALYNIPFGTTVNPGGMQVMLYFNGVWTRHTFTGIQGNGTCVACAGLALDDPSLVVGSATTAINETSRPANVFVFSDGGTASVKPKFWSWVPTLDRPGSENLPTVAPNNQFNAERAGDDSSTQVSGQVTFPEIHLENSDEFMVQGVVVDFRVWNTGGSLSNHFDLEVDVLRPYDDVSPHVSLTSAWDEAGTFSSAAGTVRREVFQFGDQGVGNGYQLHFTNCRGIALQRIQVILDTVHVRGI